MAEHRYFLMSLNPSVASKLTASDEAKLQRAFQALSTYENPDAPQFQFQFRANLTRTSFLVEAVWDAPPTKAVLVNHLATQLGLSVTTLNSAVTVQTFGSTWEDSRQAVLVWLAAHRTEWEVDIYHLPL